MKTKWEIRKLGDLFDITSSKRVFKAEWKRQGIPFYRAREIVRLANQGFVANELFISEEMFNEYSAKYGVPREGDIMVTGVGTLGICYVVQKNDRFYFKDGNIIWLERKSDASSRFVEYAFQSDFLREQIDDSVGATVGTFTIIKAKNILIPLPPLQEQQRIVGILDQAFAAIATAKANAEKNLQNARALFESHLNDVFTKRGEGWNETTLGTVCEFVGGSQPPKSVFSKIERADHIRLIQIRDYKSDKHVVYIPRTKAKRFCKADDVMIGRYGPPLFQILRGLDGAYNVALMKAVPNESKLTRNYLFYFLKHSDILQYVIYHSARAAGQIGVTKETLQPYPIALPPLAVQETIAQKIKETETETHRLESIYQRKIAALEELKKSLLHDAFRGAL